MDRPNEPEDHAFSPDPSQRDAAAQHQRLREELLAAADEEAAAIVEAARQEITVTVRRARRDLRLIRAQLQLAGVEPRPLPMAELDSRHVARIAAASLEDETPPPLVAEESERDTPNDVAVAPAPRIHLRTSPAVIVAVITVLFVTGAVTGWRYLGSRPQAQPADVTGSAVANGNAAVGQQRPEPAVVAQTAQTAPRPGAVGATSRSVIRLQTLRPVWMRVDVDGAGDIGHEYPAGATKELAPTRSLVIRAGDAGAVLLSVGTEVARPLGAAGQVVTRRIAAGDAAEPAGAKPPAPASSPAPAVAPAPTPLAVAGIRPDRSATELPRPQVATPVPAPSQKPPVAASSAATAAAPPANAAPAGAPPAGGPPTGEPQSAIFARHVQWLDAYTHGDQATIAALAADGYSVPRRTHGPVREREQHHDPAAGL